MAACIPPALPGHCLHRFAGLRRVTIVLGQQGRWLCLDNVYTRSASSSSHVCNSKDASEVAKALHIYSGVFAAVGRDQAKRV